MFFLWAQFCDFAQVVIIIEKNIWPNLIIFKNESKNILSTLSQVMANF
jgi:3-deoxy-D-manno-octulosonic-acid transferase